MEPLTEPTADRIPNLSESYWLTVDLDQPHEQSSVTNCVDVQVLVVRR